MEEALKDKIREIISQKINEGPTSPRPDMRTIPHDLRERKRIQWLNESLNNYVKEAQVGFDRLGNIREVFYDGRNHRLSWWSWKGLFYLLRRYKEI